MSSSCPLVSGEHYYLGPELLDLPKEMWGGRARLPYVPVKIESVVMTGEQTYKTKKRKLGDGCSDQEKATKVQISFLDLLHEYVPRAEVIAVDEDAVISQKRSYTVTVPEDAAWSNLFVKCNDTNRASNLESWAKAEGDYCGAILCTVDRAVRNDTRLALEATAATTRPLNEVMPPICHSKMRSRGSGLAPTAAEIAARMPFELEDGNDPAQTVAWLLAYRSEGMQVAAEAWVSSTRWVNTDLCICPSKRSGLYDALCSARPSRSSTAGICMEGTARARASGRTGAPRPNCSADDS